MDRVVTIPEKIFFPQEVEGQEVISQKLITLLGSYEKACLVQFLYRCLEDPKHQGISKEWKKVSSRTYGGLV